jgi:hypothetical protein
MRNSNDKEKKKKPAAAAKDNPGPPVKAKRDQKLTSKAASQKNYLQDDTDSEGARSDNEADDEKDDIESVSYLRVIGELLTFDLCTAGRMSS